MLDSWQRHSRVYATACNARLGNREGTVQPIILSPDSIISHLVGVSMQRTSATMPGCSERGGAYLADALVATGLRIMSVKAGDTALQALHLDSERLHMLSHGLVATPQRIGVRGMQISELVLETGNLQQDGS